MALVTCRSPRLPTDSAEEPEFLDSLTNERLAAAIDTFNGSKKNGFSKLGATKEAFEFWGKRLRVTLDKAHGIPQK